MAIPCPGCDREYDVTLFQFGRTLHCTCGARVGVEARVQMAPRDDEEEPRFMVDAMLGRLARWLRILGYDAEYDAEISDGDLVRRSLEEGRVLVTRDRLLPEEWRVGNVQLLESERIEAQLRELTARYRLEWRSRLFTRCSRCNVRMEQLPRDLVAGRVPPRIQRDHSEFRGCPRCQRVYWRGSHTDRIRRVLERALGGAEGTEPQQR